MREAILKAAEKAGEDLGEDGLVAYLLEQAREKPTPFLNLLWKMAAEEDEYETSKKITRIEIVAPQLEEKKPNTCR